MVEDSIGHGLIESEVSKIVVANCGRGIRSIDVERKRREATVDRGRGRSEWRRSSTVRTGRRSRRTQGERCRE